MSHIENDKKTIMLLLVMLLMRIKFNIIVRLLSTKLGVVPCTQVVKTYYKATICYQQTMGEWEHAHRDILKQGISVVCIIKFEYKSITHFKLLGKDYSMPLFIFIFSFLIPQTFK
jgi:hypothetical protein